MGQREAWLRKSDRRLHRESGGDDDGGKLADDRHLGRKVDLLYPTCSHASGQKKRICAP